jgi:hypothetical protein
MRHECLGTGRQLREDNGEGASASKKNKSHPKPRPLSPTLPRVTRLKVSFQDFILTFNAACNPNDSSDVPKTLYCVLRYVISQDAPAAAAARKPN